MRRSYVVEILFTLVLFTLFVVGSFFILLSGANAYQKQVEEIQNVEELRLPLSYISTKLHQANKDNVSIEIVDGINCLLIEEVIDNKTYVDMFYYQDGYLYETFSALDLLSIKNGERVCAISNLIMEDRGEDGLYFEVTNDDNITKSLNIVLR